MDAITIVDGRVYAGRPVTREEARAHEQAHESARARRERWT